MIGMKKLTVALALGLASSSVLALGLGQIKVKSGLNEPLRAEIPVLSSDASELRGLKVELASADDFNRIGLSLAQMDVPLQFAVVKRHGATLIEITTKAAVSEPALDFLVEVNWPKGKLLREYTILLDPPNMAPLVATTPVQAAAPAAKVTTQAANPPAQTAAVAPPPTQSTTTAAAPAKPAQVTQTPVTSASASGTVTVNKGDTLWQIANNTHDAAGVGLNAMMLALQRTNPHAFYKNNINALKSGAVLRMPNQAELTKLRPGAAHAAVREQNQRWANVQAQAPVMVSNTGGSAGSHADDTGQTQRERLQLVPPTHGSDDADSRPGVAGGTGNTRVTALKAQLANAQTALTSAQQQSTDLQGRVTDLEGINSKNAHLISLKNAEIAELQRKLAQAQKEAASAAAVVAPLAKEVPTVAAASVAKPAAPSSVSEDIFNANVPASATTSAALAAASSTENVMDVAAPVASASTATTMMTPTSASTAMNAAAATTAAESVPTTPTQTQQSAPTNATETQPWYMQGWLKWLIGLVILALIALGLMKSRGKKAEPTVLATAAAEGDAVGDDDDEEYALINEIEQRPDDLASHMELASLYYAQRDQDKFEATAEAMHEHVTDPQCDEWQQVRAMGEELCPDAPLFASLHSDGSALPAAPAADLHDDHDDFDLHAAETPAAKSSEGYSFDFNLTPPPAAKDAAPADHAATLDSDDDELDVHGLSDVDADDDLGFGIASTSTSDAGIDTPHEHEYDEETAHGSFSSDPVDTKLDLARAYQDMGDAEGARAMLDEVLAEGSDVQKEVARKLLEELN